MTSVRSARIVVLGLAVLVSSAVATPIAFTGDGTISGNFYRFDARSDEFTFHVDTLEGTTVIDVCATGATCAVTRSFEAGPFPPSVQFDTWGSWMGVTAPGTFGRIGLAFRIEVPAAAAQDREFTATVPIALRGTITGIQTEAGDFQQLWRISFAAAGQGTFSGIAFANGSAILRAADLAFAGRAEEVPEPGTLLVSLAGLILLALGAGLGGRFRWWAVPASNQRRS